ncbi:MAG TPA: hypothetical protein VEQ34_06575 [Pyrinomonadaceae bacterium]|nr:hypothetical protein [Pyrinomonadaceae bacterium]
MKQLFRALLLSYSPSKENRAGRNCTDDLVIPNDVVPPAFVTV